MTPQQWWEKVLTYNELQLEHDMEEIRTLFRKFEEQVFTAELAATWKKERAEEKADREEKRLWRERFLRD